MGGEGAGKKERLVTDTVNRWEVLSAGEPRWGGGECREEVGRGGRGQKDSEQTSPGKTGVATEVRAPPR